MAFEADNAENKRREKGRGMKRETRGNTSETIQSLPVYNSLKG